MAAYRKVKCLTSTVTISDFSLSGSFHVKSNDGKKNWWFRIHLYFVQWLSGHIWVTAQKN